LDARILQFISMMVIYEIYLFSPPLLEKTERKEKKRGNRANNGSPTN
jgi:hypothetical protein